MSKILRYVTLRGESVYGEAYGTGLSDLDLDVESVSLDTPAGTAVTYSGGIGRSVGEQILGNYSGSGNFVTGTGFSVLKYFLPLALGETVTGVGKLSAYGTQNTNLPSFKIGVGKDIFEHRFMGAIVNSLNLQLDGDYIKTTVDVAFAKDMIEPTIKAASGLSLPAERKLTRADVTVKRDTINITPEIKELSLNINNNLDPGAGFVMGSRHPEYIPAGQRDITISMALRFKDMDQLKKYWGGGLSPSGVSQTTAFEINIGSDIVLKVPKLSYQSVVQTPSGKSEIIQNITGLALTSEIDTKVTDMAAIFTTV